MDNFRGSTVGMQVAEAKAELMNQPQTRASKPPATIDLKRRRRLDQLSLEELLPLTCMLPNKDGAQQPRERWTPGRTAGLTRDARAARLARDIPMHSLRDRGAR